MRTLVAKYRNILRNVDTSYIRNIHSTIPWNDRLITILGPGYELRKIENLHKLFASFS